MSGVSSTTIGVTAVDEDEDAVIDGEEDAPIDEDKDAAIDKDGNDSGRDKDGNIPEPSHRLLRGP